MTSSRLFIQILFVSCVCLIPTGVLPGEEHAINVTVFTTKMLQDCPLEILDLKPPERVGDPPRVHLRNISSKQTVRFWIEAEIMTPQGGLTRTNSNGPNQFRPSERIIPPGGEVDALEDVLQSTSLASAAKELRSNCLRVAVIVLSVDFADGTFWHGDSQRAAFRIDLPASEQGTCTPSASAEPDLMEMRGVGFTAGRVTSPKYHGPVQSYSFSCPIRRVGGTLHAICDM
jgi:hypothetical protein